MILQNRRYHSGQLFALWRWTDVVLNGDLYLRRLNVAQIPYVGAKMIHWIHRPDPQRDLHDHPVSFVSLVVRGGYTEERADGATWRRRLLCGFRPERRTYEAGQINYVRATDCHRIVSVLPNTLTLVLAGPKVREWGFHTRRGWIHWKEYESAGESK
jgi:hypothetical protein